MLILLIGYNLLQARIVIHESAYNMNDSAR